MKRSTFVPNGTGKSTPNSLMPTISNGSKNTANNGMLISANIDGNANGKHWAGMDMGAMTMHKSKHDLFTPEELEEIRRADEELEAEYSAMWRERKKKQMLRRKLKAKRKAQYRQYYAKSRARRLAYQKTYYAKRREQIRAKARDHYQRNREKVLKQKSAYRDAHREELRQKARDYYQKNRETIREKQRAYREQQRSGKHATD